MNFTARLSVSDTPPQSERLHPKLEQAQEAIREMIDWSKTPDVILGDEKKSVDDVRKQAFCNALEGGLKAAGVGGAHHTAGYFVSADFPKLTAKTLANFFDSAGGTRSMSAFGAGKPPALPRTCHTDISNSDERYYRAAQNLGYTQAIAAVAKLHPYLQSDNMNNAQLRPMAKALLSSVSTIGLKI